MQSGAYNNKIEIQKRTVAVDTVGNAKKTWTTFKHDFAYVNGVSGREYWDAMATNNENTIDFTLRYKPYFETMNTKDYRVAFKGEYYNITTIDNVRYANKTVKLRCTARNGKDNS